MNTLKNLKNAGMFLKMKNSLYDNRSTKLRGNSKKLLNVVKFAKIKLFPNSAFLKLELLKRNSPNLTAVRLWLFYFVHSSFIVHRSSFIVHQSSFIVHRSSFIIHCSLFIVHCSLFIVHRSSFIVHCSFLYKKLFFWYATIFI